MEKIQSIFNNQNSGVYTQGERADNIQTYQIVDDKDSEQSGVNYKFDKWGKPIERVTGKRTMTALLGFAGDTLAVCGAMVVIAFRGISDIGYGLAQSDVIHDRSAFNGNRARGNSGYKPMRTRGEGPIGGLTRMLSRISK